MRLGGRSERDRGVTTAEYALFIGIIAMLAVVAMETLRERAFNTFDETTAQVGTPIPGEEAEGVPGGPDPDPGTGGSDPTPAPGNPDPTEPDPGTGEPEPGPPPDPDPTPDPDPAPPSFTSPPSCEDNGRRCTTSVDAPEGSIISWRISPSFGTIPSGATFNQSFPEERGTRCGFLNLQVCETETEYTVTATVEPGQQQLRFKVSCSGRTLLWQNSTNCSLSAP